MNRARPKTALAAPPLSFIRFLETNLRDSPPRQKGARTRDRLTIATAKMLESSGYHTMRVTDITDCAGLAEGSFYVYFKDKKDASLATLSAFIGDFVDLILPEDTVHIAFDSIRTANRRWFELCRANRGLMRCIYQLGDEDVDFARLVQKSTRRWYDQVSRNVQLDRSDAQGKSVLLTIYFLGSMMDEIVRKLIIFPDREFYKLLKSWNAGDVAVADAASVMWIRVFNPSAKLPDDLPAAAKELAQMLWHE